MTPVQPRIRAYHYPNGNPYWRVDCRLPSGGTYQKKHRDEVSAQKDATRLIRLYLNAGNQDDWKRYELAVAAVQASDNADAKEIPLPELVRWAAERYVNPAKLKTVEDYVEDLLKLKEEQGRRELTIVELRRCLGIFARQCGKTGVNDFTQVGLDAFVAKHANGPRSLRRWRNHLKHFFDWLCGTSKMSPNPHPVLKKSPITGWPVVSQDDDAIDNIVILTAAECETVLREAAKHNAQRMFAWLFFTGMRPFEAVRFWTDPELGWNAINLNKAVISLPGRSSKRRKPRKIRIRPVLLEWLRHYDKEKYPTWMTTNWRNKYTWSRLVLPKEKLVADTPRHTFISLLIEDGAPWAKIELEVGNTKEMQMEHYAQLVEDPADAKMFWALSPSKIGVFDVPETEWSEQVYATRVKTMLENKAKILHKRNGQSLFDSKEVA
jgi:integrase